MGRPIWPPPQSCYKHGTLGPTGLANLYMVLFTLAVAAGGAGQSSSPLCAVGPNPSLEPTRYGRQCKPGLRYSVTLSQSGLTLPASARGSARTLGPTRAFDEQRFAHSAGFVDTFDESRFARPLVARPSCLREHFRLWLHGRAWSPTSALRAHSCRVPSATTLTSTLMPSLAVWSRACPPLRMVTLARLQSEHRASCQQVNRGIAIAPCVGPCSSGPRSCALGPNLTVNRTRRHML
jgi:hypothetical protein